jgi:hypothetical protein
MSGNRDLIFVIALVCFSDLSVQAFIVSILSAMELAN